MIRDYKQQELAEILHEHYSVVVGSMKRLVGYYDRNYLVANNQAPPHKYILKISSYHQDEAILKLQTQVLGSMKDLKTDPCHFPELVLTNQAQQMIKIEEEGKVNYFRLLKFVEGIQMTNVPNYPDHISQEIGIVTGKMVLFFKDLTENQQIQQQLKAIDMLNYFQNLWTLPKLYEEAIQYFDEQTYKEVEQAKLTFDKIQPVLKEMPKQLIHNDICLTNLLVKPEKDNDYVLSGIIDFNSICYCEPIIELAVVAARVKLEEADPFKHMMLVIRGFTSVRKLTDKEQQIIFPLIRCRLAFLCLLTWKQYYVRNNKQQYIKDTMESLKKFLHTFSKEWMEDQFKKEIAKLND